MYLVNMKKYLIALLFLCLCITSCQNKVMKEKVATLFELKDVPSLGINFKNTLQYTESFNPYTYRNFYNGGGVAIGDINNDGLSDIYFTGNQVDNKLYLNKGNWQFKDITEEAGVACANVWSSGVSMVDINGDGLLDIYVCKSGDMAGENRHNELFINNGDLTFTEKAKEYGIADKGLSTHAAFFDYDKDGDLDCYLLNNSFRSVGGYDLRKDQRKTRDPEGGNKLYRNDNGKFTDVSEFAGIYGSAIGFGLGVTIGDIDRDGWQDIYVSNDFFERDYLYINQRNGTFSEEIVAQMPEISLSSMGADMADINNDGYPEVFVTDMLPEDEARIKTKTTFEDWDKYQLNVRNGYHRQFTRNALQLNNGNGTFSEIGRLAGVYATDWSWGALIFDMDNDGLKDIFVANGIYKDLTDQDYIQYSSDPTTINKIRSRQANVITELVDMIPSTPLPNYAFINQGNNQFSNKATQLGLAQPGHSNGSAYGDLDNDGDLDIVTNNIEIAPFIYENKASEGGNWLIISLETETKNTKGLGSQVTVYADNKKFYQELAPFRGFESSVEPRLHFGLGNIQKIDSVEIIWPNLKYTVIRDIEPNKFVTYHYDSLDKINNPTINNPSSNAIFKDITEHAGLSYTHIENQFVDFDRDRLLYHMLSTEGPKAAKADVNGDGLEDIYLAGAKDMAGQLFIQNASGTFKTSNKILFEKDKISEDTDCVFLDVEGDGDKDLYVTSGGNEFPSTSSALRDRLYINDGSGIFSKSHQFLPIARYENSSCVSAADFDQDGDIDLAVAIRAKPFLYGIPVNVYILANDGQGKFSNITEVVAPSLIEKGLITDLIWEDMNGDAYPELLVAGEWTPLSIMVNQQGKLIESSESNLNAKAGFWSCIITSDLDNDGDMDIIAGNHGLNSRFKASSKQAITMHVSDFDKNGTVEQIISVPNSEDIYPMVLRHDLVKQMPTLKKKYLKYENYKEQTIEDIFTPEQLQRAVKWEVNELRSMVLLNDGKGNFTFQPLPIEAQFAPLKALLTEDIDGDGYVDLIAGGNFMEAKPETGIYAATYGLYLKGNGDGSFEFIPARESGLQIDGAIRDFVLLEKDYKRKLLVLKNNATAQIMEISNKPLP